MAVREKRGNGGEEKGTTVLLTVGRVSSEDREGILSGRREGERKLFPLPPPLPDSFPF